MEARLAVERAHVPFLGRRGDFRFGQLIVGRIAAVSALPPIATDERTALTGSQVPQADVA
jgi:hypothetical protein